ncbi:hypothetical protein GCM10023321_63780 [Pseudonocardia eucalypti]|uniref:Secreted protein n=1 Tax=Pseudonocardia eucalypti TaxID=648755 RepID=A0ABP9QXJ5_9PSEU|nr:hypothetical protein [Pseudonocardia eucalypti]
MPIPKTRRTWPLLARVVRALIITMACCMCAVALAYPAPSQHTATGTSPNDATVDTPVQLVATHTVLASTSPAPAGGLSLPAIKANDRSCRKHSSTRDDATEHNNGGRDTDGEDGFVLRAGPVDVVIVSDNCAREDRDRDDRDRGRVADRRCPCTPNQERDYPRGGWREYPNERQGPQVCRFYGPGEHPDLPDGGIICTRAERAPSGRWGN